MRFFFFLEETEFPKAPELWACCGSGCQNCVWIEYAINVSNYIENLNLNKKVSAIERKNLLNKIINENIDDANLKSFIQLELSQKKLI